MPDEQKENNLQWDRMYFDDWVRREGLELIEGYEVKDVYTVPLRSWERTGGSGVHIKLEGTGDLASAYVCEIPPGGSLKPQRHLYDEVVFVLSGMGSTKVWVDENKPNVLEWSAGSLLTIPLNAWHQHFNGQGGQPARYLAVTTAPAMMNFLRCDDFIFNNPYTFRHFYNGEDDYFKRRKQAVYIKNSRWLTNFVSDIYESGFRKGDRGQGTTVSVFEFPDTVLGAHVLQIPGGTYTKYHRHGPGAHVLWLKGEGYTLLWPDGGEKMKAAIRPGAMVVPPSWWWHLYAVTSMEPAVHLALKISNHQHLVSRLYIESMRSSKEGGNLVEYEDADPRIANEIRAMFAEECQRKGTDVRM